MLDSRFRPGFAKGSAEASGNDSMEVRNPTSITEGLHQGTHGLQLPR